MFHTLSFNQFYLIIFVQEMKLALLFLLSLVTVAILNSRPSLIFTILIPYRIMLHVKFDKNWCGGFREKLFEVI